MSLAYQLDNPSSLKIYGDHGEEGTLSVDLIPTDANGEKNYGSEEAENEEDDHFIENPAELLGRTIYYKVVIKKAMFRELKWKDVFV